MFDFFLYNFSIDETKLNWQVKTCAVVLWCIVIYCGVWSINQQPFNRRERMSWTIILIAVPLFGMLIYLFKAWYNASTGALSFWKKPKKKRKFYGY